MARKTETVEWTKTLASAEFGIAPKTLNMRLRRAGIEPNAKGFFTTKQICDAVFGDIDGEKLRLVREQADKIAIENAEARRELVKASEVLPILERGLGAIKAVVASASNLESEDKEKILKQMRTMWDSACGAVSTSGGDVRATPELHSEPMGGAVQVS